MKNTLLNLFCVLTLFFTGCSPQSPHSSPSKEQTHVLNQGNAKAAEGDEGLNTGSNDANEIAIYHNQDNGKTLLKKYAGDQLPPLKQVLNQSTKMGDDFTMIQLPPTFTLILEFPDGQAQTINVYKKKNKWILQNKGKYYQGHEKLNDYFT